MASTTRWTRRKSRSSRPAARPSSTPFQKRARSCSSPSSTSRSTPRTGSWATSPTTSRASAATSPVLTTLAASSPPSRAWRRYRPARVLSVNYPKPDYPFFLVGKITCVRFHFSQDQLNDFAVVLDKEHLGGTFEQTLNLICVFAEV